jgi:hypothetical protein
MGAPAAGATGDGLAELLRSYGPAELVLRLDGGFALPSLATRRIRVCP